MFISKIVLSLTYQNQTTMFKYQLRILAQYEENYAAHDEDWNGETESWKNKGGVEFIATVDSDFRMVYSESEVRTAVEAIVAAKSTKIERFTLLHMEYADSNPEDITSELLQAFAKIEPA